MCTYTNIAAYISVYMQFSGSFIPEFTSRQLEWVGFLKYYSLAFGAVSAPLLHTNTRKELVFRIIVCCSRWSSKSVIISPSESSGRISLCSVVRSSLVSAIVVIVWHRAEVTGVNGYREAGLTALSHPAPFTHRCRDEDLKLFHSATCIPRLLNSPPQYCGFV